MNEQAFSKIGFSFGIFNLSPFDSEIRNHQAITINKFLMVLVQACLRTIFWVLSTIHPNG